MKLPGSGDIPLKSYLMWRWWNCPSESFGIDLWIHYPGKNANACFAFVWDTSPNINICEWKYLYPYRTSWWRYDVYHFWLYYFLFSFSLIISQIFIWIVMTLFKINSQSMYPSMHILYSFWAIFPCIHVCFVRGC